MFSATDHSAIIKELDNDISHLKELSESLSQSCVINYNLIQDTKRLMLALAVNQVKKGDGKA